MIDERLTAYLTDERPIMAYNEAFADALQKIVNKLRAGESSQDWGIWVKLIGIMMERKP